VNHKKVVDLEAEHMEWQRGTGTWVDGEHGSDVGIWVKALRIDWMKETDRNIV
jgi:hypothetical protein